MLVLRGAQRADFHDSRAVAARSQYALTIVTGAWTTETGRPVLPTLQGSAAPTLDGASSAALAPVDLAGRTNIHVVHEPPARALKGSHLGVGANAFNLETVANRSSGFVQ